jgi:hypothetical protein
MISTLIANPFFGEKLIYVSFFVLVCAEGVGVHIDAKFRVQKVSLQKKRNCKKKKFRDATNFLSKFVLSLPCCKNGRSDVTHAAVQASISVEQSSTIEYYCHPPQIWSLFYV